MAVRPPLPYFAPEGSLPTPRLPTVAEILASETFLVRYGAAPIVRVGDHYVVKYGRKVSLQEGENMLFVRQFTSVPVPTVYALFHDKETGNNFIIQEYIPGTMLDLLWDKLSYTEKMRITWQLRQNMEELRRIPSPGYYGGIWEQPAPYYSFRGLESAFSAAQETEEYWAYGLWRSLDLKLKGNARRILRSRWCKYQAIFKGHEAVFTHGGLYPGNIMLNEETGTVVIINWELSGWYPSFWEYCCAIILLQYRRDWALWVPVILDKYVEELKLVKSHRKLMLKS
ncbi:kinase-like domain-containing protein [Chaetomium fimeti]|uniref:Kinase-like domain-containing protein n=1 Tax=Chaetomium fimeti TaxID=1854472 RepID=A0AAE0LTS6_9PEZI|nr:kinase-like domain-containing protein [Chaetomium fimeti]